MNCSECQESFCRDVHIPIILIKCGHTFCEVIKFDMLIE